MSICSLDVTFGQSPGRTSDRSEATKSALEEKTDAASQLILKHQGGLASVSRTADELVSALSANQLIPSDFTAHSWKDSGRAYYIDPFYDDSLKLGMANLYGYRFRDGPLTHIPNSVMNLDLDLRESSRGSSILSRPILTIWGDLRSTIPGALARSKFQVADRVGYNTIVTFQLNLRTGAILIKIPQIIALFALEVQSKLIYSSSKEQVVFEFTPDLQFTRVKVYAYDQKMHCFLPNDFFCVGLHKMHDPKQIIPAEQRSAKVNALINGKLGSRPVIEAAIEWMGKGSYICEFKGLYSTDIHARPSTCIQDVKVVALGKAGEAVFSYQIERSITDIARKKANMNCWQFCLLSYIEAGRLSWKAVGHLYQEIDSIKEEVRVPDAMKYGKYHFVDFTNEETTPKAGDIICFRRDLHNDWHCALFVKKIGDEDQFSVIEILGDVVREKTYGLKYESVTFVKSEDVEGNILNFLAHREVYSPSLI